MARKRNRYADIAWTQRQVERLEKAVNAYNQAIEDKAAEWSKSGVAFLLPPIVDLSAEIDNIQTSQQLNARVASLNRIHRSNAFDIDSESQLTKYELHEGQIAKSQINRYRVQRVKQMGGNLVKQPDGSYRPKDTFTYVLVNETNLMPTSQPVDRTNVHRLQKLMNNYRGGNRVQLAIFWENYVDQWMKFYSDTAEYSDVLNIVYDVMEAPLDVQNEIFYQYDEYGSFEYMYPLYVRIPLERKAKNIANYWRNVRAKYLEG